MLCHIPFVLLDLVACWRSCSSALADADRSTLARSPTYIRLT
jgi:hypothetical protein